MESSYGDSTDAGVRALGKVQMREEVQMAVQGRVHLASSKPIIVPQVEDDPCYSGFQMARPHQPGRQDGLPVTGLTTARPGPQVAATPSTGGSVQVRAD
jgi:hypothetical protein